MNFGLLIAINQKELRENNDASINIFACVTYHEDLLPGCICLSILSSGTPLHVKNAKPDGSAGSAVKENE